MTDHIDKLIAHHAPSMVERFRELPTPDADAVAEDRLERGRQARQAAFDAALPREGVTS